MPHRSCRPGPNVSALGALDPEQDLAPAMQQITTAAKTLLRWTVSG